ncbi:MAG TPA: YafY family protein [Parasegetibacter sp.]
MNSEVLKRFDRIVAILIQLQSKRVVKAQELADRFGVSLRTIYRDVRTLEESGVPIVSEAGIGYSIMEGYRLPPVMFTREEATSFIAAEKLMQRFSDKSLGRHFQSAIYKIKSVLRWSEKDLYDSLEKNVLVHETFPLFKDGISNALEILMNGIVNKQQVLIFYLSFESDEVSERVIEPIGMFHEYNFWYLVAYCHLRHDYRQFRSDRIHSIRLLDKPFTREHERLDYYLKEKNKSPEKLIRLRVKKKAAKYIKNSRRFYGFISEEVQEDYINMNFMCSEEAVQHFVRWYMMIGDYAEIIEPEPVKIAARELLQKIATRL